MTSFSPYAIGAVADWLHRVVASLDAARPGFRDSRFSPGRVAG
jgi:alpha-L-rhamnosidase